MTAQTFEDIDVSGDGSQTLIGTEVNGDVVQQVLNFVRGQPALYLSPDEVGDRVRCHVPARNHDLVVKALETERSVLLAGPAGCGRETTAIAAFRELVPGIPVRRLSIDAEDSEEIRANGACGYLVRAADEEPDRLRACLDAAAAAGGYVAVIGDERERRRLGLRLACIDVEPPSAFAVYRRRLAVRGLHDWASWEEARSLLAGVRPGDARRLADIVEEIHRTGGDAGDAVRAYGRWTEELREWFRTNPAPQDRALLVSAATLEPATEIDVYGAALALARRLRIEVNGSGLAWFPATGVRGLLRADGERGRIVFRRPDFARSVLRHVWEDYPLVRPDLLAWLTELVLDPATSDEPRNTIAEIFADLTAEHDLPGKLVDAARSWAEAGQADAAYIALARTCLHARIGGRIRTQLYEWSRNTYLSQTLKLAIARVCEPLGQTHPSIALTRLKHLATRGNPQVRSQVVRAALGLAHSGHAGRVRAAVIDWCGGGPRESLSPAQRRRRTRTGAEIFLALAAEAGAHGLPALLYEVDAETCVPAWRAAMEAVPALGWEEAAVFWLDAALARPEVRDGIVRMFVGAARPAPEAMIALVRGWAAGDGARRGIRDAIVLGLSRPWWLWLVRWLAVWVSGPAAGR